MKRPFARTVASVACAASLAPWLVAQDAPRVPPRPPAAPATPAEPAAPAEPAEPDAPAEPGAAEGAEAPAAFPSLAPFEASRFWRVMGDELSSGSGFESIRSQIQTQYEITAASKEVGAKYGPSRKKGEPEALMEDVPELAVRARWATVPFALSALFGLAGAQAWDAGQLERALDAAGVLEGLPKAPKLAFTADDLARNRALVAEAAAWYEAQLAIPQHYAAMILTDDDGPYVGLEVKGRKLLPSNAPVPLGDDLVLHLAREKKGDEPYVLQCVRGKKLLWSRRISDSPYGTVRKAAFDRQPPTPLDRLGWKVHLRVAWQMGEEYAHAYLGPDGDLICYFMSW
jgi:hypothetical protein